MTVSNQNLRFTLQTEERLLHKLSEEVQRAIALGVDVPDNIRYNITGAIDDLRDALDIIECAVILAEESSEECEEEDDDDWDEEFYDEDEDDEDHEDFNTEWVNDASH